MALTHSTVLLFRGEQLLVCGVKAQVVTRAVTLRLCVSELAPSHSIPSSPLEGHSEDGGRWRTKVLFRASVSIWRNCRRKRMRDELSPTNCCPSFQRSRRPTILPLHAVTMSCSNELQHVDALGRLASMARGLLFLIRPPPPSLPCATPLCALNGRRPHPPAGEVIRTMHFKLEAQSEQRAP